MTFESPLYFLLLLLLIPFVAWHFLFHVRRQPSLLFSSTEFMTDMPRTLRIRLRHVPFFLRIIAFIALVVALARPQTNTALSTKETEGIDIMMTMDISTSMLMPDLQPNRMEAAKQVAYEFINNRPNDNIGLTLFGGEAFTQCPLTTDHATLLGMFQNVSCNLQAQGVISEGTAIGMGIASAAAHLEKSKAPSKVIILLTDGENNAGDISPLTAAEMAKKLGIRVYTILLGSSSTMQQAVATLPNGETYTAPIETSSDPSTLKEIAQSTGGIFYQAGSKQKLRDIYNDIDQLEKTKLKIANYDRHYEAYQLFAIIAFVSLLLEVLLRITWFRRIPE
ncbi:vWA domain-containing protein [Alloprevotella rava]|uniref:Ca-activated chloride channel family protein n=1 Tax=Alloprevotella rava TaxID=671218 RepID=A0A7W5UHV7_9BACT|nr:VWA domain-containing protein [Alloprevotella rava]MBB3701616.1 Ca-activated chloride channel family protein [Alloprevotella rava]